MGQTFHIGLEIRIWILEVEVMGSGMGLGF